jgi:cell wall-associated NlpC family hydrolase
LAALVLSGCNPAQRLAHTPPDHGHGGYTSAEAAARSRQRTTERTRTRPGYDDPEALLRTASRQRTPQRTRPSRRTAQPTLATTTRPTPTPTPQQVPRSEATNRPVHPEPAPSPAHLRPTAKAQRVVDAAKEYLGTRYQWGGMSRTGVDCSGLMVLAFKAADISLPRVSGDQYRYGRDLPRAKVRPGDLLFFRSGAAATIGHSGLVVEVLPSGEVKFIHAISSGVVISSLNDPHWNAHYLCACRVLPDP